MPRKPTLVARKAKSELLQIISELPAESSLPTLRELGEKFALHPSTIFRMLRDLATEGLVWQNPGGRFFPAASRKQELKGAPICFVGREMWKWSRLYQEIIEGISEVCSANGSPLALLSAPSLVRQSDPTEPPVFASSKIQKMELPPLLAAAPRGCGGFLLDHLWSDEALAASSFPGGERLQLLFGSNRNARVLFLDDKAASRLVRTYLLENGFEDVVLVTPFEGDPAIEAATMALGQGLAEFSPRKIPFQSIGQELKRLEASPKMRTCLLCPEDNTALAIADMLRGTPFTSTIQLLATQGPGMITSPIPRLHYDYRRLGKSAASAILHGTEYKPIRPCIQS